jgi:hypothetical protein
MEQDSESDYFIPRKGFGKQVSVILVIFENEVVALGSEIFWFNRVLCKFSILFSFFH